MKIVVDADGRIELLAAADFTSLNVETPDSVRSSLDAALTAADWGYFDGSHAWLSIPELQSQIIGTPSKDIAGDFDGMIGYARGKGWVSDDGSHVRAHCEWT